MPCPAGFQKLQLTKKRHVLQQQRMVCSPGAGVYYCRSILNSLLLLVFVKLFRHKLIVAALNTKKLSPTIVVGDFLAPDSARCINTQRSYKILVNAVQNLCVLLAKAHVCVVALMHYRVVWLIIQIRCEAHSHKCIKLITKNMSHIITYCTTDMNAVQ